MSEFGLEKQTSDSCHGSRIRGAGSGGIKYARFEAPSPRLLRTRIPPGHNASITSRPIIRTRFNPVSTTALVSDGPAPLFFFTMSGVGETPVDMSTGRAGP